MKLRVAYFAFWGFFGIALFSTALIWDAVGARMSTISLVTMFVSGTGISITHFERQRDWLSRSRDAASVGYTLLVLFLLLVFLLATRQMSSWQWDWGVLFRFEPAALGLTGGFLMALAFVVRSWDDRARGDGSPVIGARDEHGGADGPG